MLRTCRLEDESLTALTPHHRRRHLVLPATRCHLEVNICAMFPGLMSKFNLNFNDGHRREWRQRNECFGDCCVAEHDWFGGISVLVWAGISYDRHTDLYIIRNRALTGVPYRDKILHPIVPSSAGAYSPGFIPMDNNACPHRAQVVDQYLEQENIERMDWSARSPAHNLIEHARDMLQPRISSHDCQPRTLKELTDMLIEEWHRIPVADIQRLILSASRRCKEVINVRGGHTRCCDLREPKRWDICLYFFVTPLT